MDKNTPAAVRAYDAERVRTALNIARALVQGRDPEVFDLVAFSAAEAGFVAAAAELMEAAR